MISRIRIKDAKNRVFELINNDGSRTLYNQETGVVVEVDKNNKVDQISDPIYIKIIQGLIAMYVATSLMPNIMVE